ncbi:MULTISPECIES: STAS domain-containing protein [Shouchella]|uniref:GAF domain-containing protein n=1 Tax=Shouchella hunanensis TaxID=766894 RepID=A0ABY7WCN1_9BACI|nr:MULTISPECIES: GAF domain-containing protein [Shouchella]WDF05246.1 GAF domain-containing protein [Shouchella hunanensis]
MDETKYHSNYDSVIEVSNKLFKLVSNKLGVNTAYIARKEDEQIKIVNAFNEKETILSKDVEIDYYESSCKQVFESDQEYTTVENLMTNPKTQDQVASREWHVRGFMGVKLKSMNGDIFGTLCVMDHAEKHFSEEDVEFLKTIAEVLSYIIELDETFADIELLSVPIIPIRSGLAILALQGNINKSRGKKILEDTLNYALDHRINHFIIDLSQIKYSDTNFAVLLHSLISALRLMGVKVMLSGVPVQLAHENTIRDQLVKLDVAYVKTIEAALMKIGYVLKDVSADKE